MKKPLFSQWWFHKIVLKYQKLCFLSIKLEKESQVSFFFSFAWLFFWKLLEIFINFSILTVEAF